jgi:putative DNA primase/helicase
LCRLDARCEFPEQRTFQRDAVEYAHAARPAVVHAALTLIKCYLDAGRPKVEAAPSRFPTWDRLVRYPLMWAGLGDPLGAAGELRANDLELDAFAALLHAWHAAFGSWPKTANEIVTAADELTFVGGEQRFPELKEALDALIDRNVRAGRASALGYKLRSKRGRLFANLMIQRAKEGDLHAKVARWVVQPFGG